MGWSRLGRTQAAPSGPISEREEGLGEGKKLSGEHRIGPQ